MEGLLSSLIIGAVAGWLAGQIKRGMGFFGVIGNIILGIVGAFVGGWLFGAIGISLGGGWIGSILSAMVGALAVLFVVGIFKGK